MNGSDIGVYAAVDTVISGVVPNEKLASQTRFGSGAGVRDRLIPSTEMRTLAGLVGAMRPRAASPASPGSFPQTAAAEFPAVSAMRSTTFYQELGLAGKFRWELRRPVARQTRAYPPQIPQPKTRWNSTEFGGRQKGS